MPHTVRACALALLVASCGHNPHREGLELVEAGNIEAGIAKLEEAAKLEPRNSEYRRSWVRHRDIALQRYLAVAEAARAKGDGEAAEEIYERMLAIDPVNSRARNGIDGLKVDRRHRAFLAEADELLKKDQPAAAEAKIRTVLAENPVNREAQHVLRRIEERTIRVAADPQLSAALRKPMTLEFRDATLRQIFESISRTTELNFIIDRDVRADLRTTVFVRNSSVEDVLRFVLVTNQLERKVLSENTVLIYPLTKARDYQELVVKTFYLSNADAKAIASMIRALVKTKDMHIDEKLNVVVMRDTPEAVRMAERLVANHDLAESEVMLEVEILEVGSSALQELGIRYPDSISFSLVGADGTGGSLSLREWQNRNSDLVRLTVSNPSLALNFRNQLGRSNILANPRIRVKNKDKAKVHIGDKVPVITTTTTATGFASESVAYLDVGLKLDVEPVIFLEDEVAMKVNLEVSSIVREIRSPAGALTYQLGTRTAGTTLRLKDGETQVLAGLISDEDRKTANRIPGLGNLPIVGRLFGSHLDTMNKTEIVLLITPRVVRNLAQPELRLSEFYSGTEGAIGAAPLTLQKRPAQAAADPVVPSAPPAPEPSIPTNASPAPRVVLQAPKSVPAGDQFEVQVMLESSAALRGGLIDFVFDPSRLKFVNAEPGALMANEKEANFRANAPEALGRAHLTFATKGDVTGNGPLAKLRFQVLGAAAGAPIIRVEGLSFSNAAGNAVTAPLPPPVTLNLTR